MFLEKLDLPENSGGSEEEIRLQNDLLKLKMQAEFGAHFGGAANADLPPGIEKQFLEQMLAFHQHRDEHPPVVLSEYLGNPEFQPAAFLSQVGLESAWERVQELYDSKKLHVDFLAEYPLAVRYDFLAIELMTEEIEPPFLEGQYLCFIYEEVHPNHDYDQRARTGEFMKGFFEGSLEEFYVARQLLAKDYSSISLAEVNGLLERFHGMFDSIKEWEFAVEGTSAQRDEELPEGMPRLGFSEGIVRYTAVSRDGTKTEITGPFKLYMQCIHGWWEVNHFHVHGFSWGK